MNKQNFDLGWECTEATGFLLTAFAQWQTVNLPHDLSNPEVLGVRPVDWALTGVRW